MPVWTVRCTTGCAERDAEGGVAAAGVCAAGDCRASGWRGGACTADGVAAPASDSRDAAGGEAAGGCAAALLGAAWVERWLLPATRSRGHQLYDCAGAGARRAVGRCCARHARIGPLKQLRTHRWRAPQQACRQRASGWTPASWCPSSRASRWGRYSQSRRAACSGGYVRIQNLVPAYAIGCTRCTPGCKRRWR